MKKILFLLILTVFCSGCFALKLGVDDLRENQVPQETPAAPSAAELPASAE